MPIIFGILLLFFPETPVYYLTQEDVGRAKNSFLFFRGKNYDVESELCELSDYCHQNQDVKHSVWKTFASIQGRKSVLMSIGLMIFQQLCGINAIVFNATDIFQVFYYTVKNIIHFKMVY